MAPLTPLLHRTYNSMENDHLHPMGLRCGRRGTRDKVSFFCKATNSVKACLIDQGVVWPKINWGECDAQEPNVEWVCIRRILWKMLGGEYNWLEGMELVRQEKQTGLVVTLSSIIITRFVLCLLKANLTKI